MANTGDFPTKRCRLAKDFSTTILLIVRIYIEIAHKNLLRIAYKLLLASNGFLLSVIVSVKRSWFIGVACLVVFRTYWKRKYELKWWSKMWIHMWKACIDYLVMTVLRIHEIYRTKRKLALHEKISLFQKKVINI